MKHSSILSFAGRARRQLTLFAVGMAAMTLLPLANAATVEESVGELQKAWEVINYKAPATEKEKKFEALAARAHQITEDFSGRAEPKVWEGIILSSWAGAKGGLGALGMVKQAKALYESAIQIDGNALDGSAYNSLGVLYYKVPGWPFGFGDKAKAKEMLRKALTINPKGIDANYFYAEYLFETGEAQSALGYLDETLKAPARPGREIADEGRRAEARALIEKIKAQ